MLSDNEKLLTEKRFYEYSQKLKGLEIKYI